MNCTRARGRYLAALGLTAAAGCHGAEPSATSAPTVTVEAAPAAPAPETAAAPVATSAAPPASAAPKVAHHTGPWVPAVEPEPLVKRRPGIGICPQGPFCVPQPAEAGASAAPAPLQMCAGTVDLPSGIGPAPGTRRPTVAFDAARTTIERGSDPAACCYKWNVLCVGGRALRGPEGPITAGTARRDDWTAAATMGDPKPPPAAVREALAAYWDREAAFEHASVAAFARASLALLALGAPPDLLAATHAAAIDEIEHARLCYGLASTYGGARRGPGPLPVGGALAAPSLVDLAVETFVDGCVGEAAAALALREGAAVAEDGAVREILERIAEDEERHAELAWRTVAWALAAGGHAVVGAVRDAARSLRDEPDAGPGVAAGPDLSAHGALGEAERRAIRARAIAEVALPCLDALLAARAPSSSIRTVSPG